MRARKFQIYLGFIPVLFAVCASPSFGQTQDCEGWSAVSNLPGGRLGHAMAYDSVRGVTVLFGGSDVTSYLSDTWEWDGQFWTRIEVSGPPARFGHAMTYDNNRRVVVLFGGANQDGAMNDTWEWNGAIWYLRSSTGPEARYGHSMSFDSVRRLTTLFGGRNDGSVVSRLVWEWNGASWTQRPAVGPTPRDGQAMTYDPIRNVTVLFGGGLGLRGVSNETWEWNGAAWTFRGSSGPRAQGHPLLAFDSSRSVVVLFGESAIVGGLGETWDWNGSTWTLRNSAGPAFREGQAMACDAIRRRMVIFGGDIPPRNETWEWDAIAWSRRGGDTDRPRPGAAVSYDSLRHRTVLFGGEVDGTASSQTLEWDGGQWMTAKANGPSPRDAHAMTFDAVRGMTVLFGGRHVDGDTTDGGTSNDVVNEFGDTWEWNGATWALRSGTGPSARYGHSLTYDSRRSASVLFGGALDNGIGEILSRETWEWNGVTWTRRATTGPSMRYGQAMAFDAVRGQTVLFGGKTCVADCCTALNDTWVWSGTSWSQRIVAGPPPRFGGAMAYDTIGGVLLLYGGRDMNGNVYNDLWQWNGTAWSARVDVGPKARSGHGMVYDMANHSAFLVGGVGGYGDVWEYGCDASCGGGTLAAPLPELYSGCAGAPCYATKNRYLTFIPPAPPCGTVSTALRITFGPMPGPNDCPGIADYSAFNGMTMWVGPEHLFGDELLDTLSGVFELQSTPRFRDWRSVNGGVVFVADCNIVPCASYTIQAVTEDGLATGDYSPPLFLSTTPTWGDVTGAGGLPADGAVNALDVAGVVDRFVNLPGSPPKAACDLFGNRPWQGAFASIDALDVSAVLDAFRGVAYPLSGPVAPAACSGGR